MAKLYKVIDIQERTSVSRLGKVAKINRVTAETHSGTVFTVDIPEADFSKDKVDQILTDKATMIDEIREL